MVNLEFLGLRSDFMRNYYSTCYWFHMSIGRRIDKTSSGVFCVFRAVVWTEAVDGNPCCEEKLLGNNSYSMEKWHMGMREYGCVFFIFQNAL